jgi:hypothetical protein
LIAEKGDEASSSQALSEENHAKLKEIFSLLQSVDAKSAPRAKHTASRKKLA